MLPAQIPKTNIIERIKNETSITADIINSSREDGKADRALAYEVDRALWKNDVIRTLEYHEINVQVKDGIVCLRGHIVGTTSQSRILNAIRAIPGVMKVSNNLVLDDKLTSEVAGALGKLEQTYQCKFFTGSSHGVVSINGIVSDENVKLLAEKSAASNPNVRGVINNVCVSGSKFDAQVKPFQQPIVGEIIYFLDGISGAVKQVVINPNNRRVTDMIVYGKFIDQRSKLNPSNSEKNHLSERLIVVPMHVVRYLTKVSGFLYITSTTKNQYQDFAPTAFGSPGNDWVPPYPYYLNDVLFRVEQLESENTRAQIVQHLPPFELTAESKEQYLWEQIPTEENLG